jgi:hypothetical protein
VRSESSISTRRVPARWSSCSCVGCPGGSEASQVDDDATRGDHEHEDDRPQRKAARVVALAAETVGEVGRRVGPVARAQLRDERVLLDLRDVVCAQGERVGDGDLVELVVGGDREQRVLLAELAQFGRRVRPVGRARRSRERIDVDDEELDPRVGVQPVEGCLDAVLRAGDDARLVEHVGAVEIDGVLGMGRGRHGEGERDRHRGTQHESRLHRLSFLGRYQLMRRF